MRLTKADAALLVRATKADNALRYIARCNNQNGKVWPTPPRSYALAIMGDSRFNSRAGSIWKLSEFLADGSASYCR